MAVIKNLVNRRSFALSDYQVGQIHAKFKIMSNHRLDFIKESRKPQPTRSMVLPVELIPSEGTKSPDLFEGLSNVPIKQANERGSVGSLEVDD